MAVLGEIVYFMLLGSAFIGALIGGMIIHYLKMEKTWKSAILQLPIFYFWIFKGNNDFQKNI